MDESTLIKILSLTGKPFTPSTRLRIYKMAPFLKQYNINLNIVRYPKSFRELKNILYKSSYDILWLQKKMPNYLKYFLFKFVKKPVIFDFDDNLVVRMKPKNGSFDSLARRIKFKLIKDFSTGFTCGNKFLAELVEDSQKPYIIYPTCVPINVPKKDFSQINEPPIIGWIGLSGGFMYIDEILEDLKKLYKEIKFKLVIISNEPYPEKASFIVNKKWSLETQENEIAKFDIGIMPLNINSPYDKGKCSYKLLQYLAAGVIAVGEAYGNNIEVIKNGVNGFLVYKKKWYETLRDILFNLDSLYPEIQKNALKTAKLYSFENNAPKLANFFRSFL